MARQKEKKKTDKKNDKKNAPKGGPPKRLPRWIREGIGITLIGCAVFLFLSLGSYSPETDPGFFHEISPAPADVKNLGGPVGSYTASFLKETIGLASYFVGALVVGFALLVIWGKSIRMTPWKVPLGLCILLVISTLAALLFPERPTPDQGGIIGHQVAGWLLESLHPVGSYLVLTVILLLCTIGIGETALLRHLMRLSTLLFQWGRALWNILSAGAGRLLQQSREGGLKAARFLKDRTGVLREKSSPSRSSNSRLGRNRTPRTRR